MQLTAFVVTMIARATRFENAIPTDIETSGQAAEALKPIAGPFAFAVFPLGIVETELLAVLCWPGQPPTPSERLAVPVMAIMMFIAADQKIMGEFPVSGFLMIVGWAATFVMAASVAGMGITASIG